MKVCRATQYGFSLPIPFPCIINPPWCHQKYVFFFNFSTHITKCFKDILSVHFCSRVVALFNKIKLVSGQCTAISLAFMWWTHLDSLFCWNIAILLTQLRVQYSACYDSFLDWIISTRYQIQRFINNIVLSFTFNVVLLRVAKIFIALHVTIVHKVCFCPCLLSNHQPVGASSRGGVLG